MVKIAISQINPLIGAIAHNESKILEGIKQAEAAGCQFVLFPEMALTGYPPEDLLLSKDFLAHVETALHALAKQCLSVIALVGVPRKNEGYGKLLMNAAAILQGGKIIGYQDKKLLPTYDVFDERRYFAPAKGQRLWDLAGKKVGITICEDLWQYAKIMTDEVYVHDPVTDLIPLKPDFVLNLSASPYVARKDAMRRHVVRVSAKALGCPVLLCNQVGANDSLIFDGRSIAFDPHGNCLLSAKAFEEDFAIVDLSAATPIAHTSYEQEEEVLHALILGMRDYFSKQNFAKGLLGLSGGIDSALVAFLAKEALGSHNVSACFLPSAYTSKESGRDARALAKTLGIHFHEISIEPLHAAFCAHLEPHMRFSQTTDENVQARLRGQILMALSNQSGALLLNTSNKSELAMGYFTLYGDMCGALAVIGDLFKTEVYALCRYIQKNTGIFPEYILTRPPSAELKHDQKDIDSLPDYQMLDPILSLFLESNLSAEEIAEQRGVPLPFVTQLISKVLLAEYKRRQAPLSLKVSNKCFAKGRYVPIVQGTK